MIKRTWLITIFLSAGSLFGYTTGPLQELTLNNVNEYNPAGFTQLMQAAALGQTENTKKLIKAGADLNIKSNNNDRDVALNIAIINGMVPGPLDVAKILIAAGADVSESNADGMQPIHRIMQIVSHQARKEILDLLMEKGADINAKNNSGDTMLHIAVNNKDDVWIDMLNKSYGQIINYNIVNNRGLTPLALADKLGFVTSIPGTTGVENSLKDAPTPLGIDFDMTKLDEKGRNGLMLAIKRGDYDFAERILNRGVPRAPRDAQAKNGRTALHFAVRSADPEKFVRLTIDQGAQVNIADQKGNTPLLYVPEIANNLGYTRLPVAQMLIKAGAKVDAKNSSGQTTLDKAQEKNQDDLVNYLLNIKNK